MKALKIIGIALFILIVVPIIIAFFLPSKVHVERSRTINAPISTVFDQVNNLKNWEKWSPWHKIDPNMKITYNENYVGEGASYSWTSNHERVGNGKMTISKSEPYTLIVTHMDFMENGVGSGAFKFEKVEKGVKVTWSMDSDMGMNPMGRWFGVFMDGMVGPDFETGLKNLEEVSM